MLTKNICKFAIAPSPDWLTTTNFIYETNHISMSQTQTNTGYRLILVVQGHGLLSVGDKSSPLASGMLCFLFDGEIFSLKPSDALEYMYITFNGSYAKDLLHRFAVTPSNRFFSGYEGLIPMWKTTLSRTLEGNIDLAALSMILYTFSLFENRDPARNKVVQQIIDLTEEHFTDSELSIGAIADKLGYNSKYISHLFKSDMNICFSDYLRNKRIEYAIFLFDHGLESVKNVASLSGFRDPFYFSSVFKKTVGVSPTEYLVGDM